VSFTGGAILWARFDAADIPADQAVAAVPREELVTVGAASLAGFLVVGGLALVVSYLCDSSGLASWGLACWLTALVIVGVLYGALGPGLHKWAVIGLVVWGAVLVVICLGIAFRTGGRFLWLGVSVFLSVGLFGGVMAYAINHKDPQVQPAAALRGPDDLGLIGYYVAVNDKRLYFGSSKEFNYLGRVSDSSPAVTGTPQPQGLVVVPCAEVTALAIGELQDKGPEVDTVAKQLLDLILDNRSRGKSPTDAASAQSGAEAQATESSAKATTMPQATPAGEKEADGEQPAAAQATNGLC